MDKTLILIIDDDPSFREIFSVKLEAVGFSVALADSGENGIQKAMEVIPDLVLLDIEMPGMTGIQVISKMKADPRLERIKVIFLTNHGEVGENEAWLDKKFASEIGAIGYIKKTDDLDKIVKEIKATLES